MPAAARASTEAAVDRGRRDRYFLSLLIAVYAAYLLVFWLSTGLAKFWDVVDWRGFQRVLVLVAPIYIVVLWRQRSRLLPFDRHMTYIPFVVWLVVTIARADASKGLMNALIVEPSIIGLLYAILLLRFTLPLSVPATTQRCVAGVLAMLVLVGAVLTALVVPAVKD